MEDSQDSNVVSDDHEWAKELHTFKQDMAEMKQSTRFIMKRLNEIKFNKGHSDLDYDNICPECGCSFGSQKDHEDLLSRIRQLEVTDKKRENEVKLLLKAVQNLVERFDIFLTNMESHLDLSTDGKIDRSHNQSLNLINLHAELKTGENVGNENNQNKLDNMATHHSEVVQKSFPTKDNVSNSNSSSVPSFAAVSSVTMETTEDNGSQKVLGSKTSSERPKLYGKKGLSQTKPSISTNSSTSVIEPSPLKESLSAESLKDVLAKTEKAPNQKNLVNSSNIPNFSKGEISGKDMDRKTETSKRSIENHRTDSKTANQIQHGSDESQKTSQEIRSQAQSAGSDPNSSSTAVGISKPNFTQIKQKQQATPGTKTERDNLDLNSEKKYVHLRYWKTEKLLAPQELYDDSPSIKTVLCIDISASMRTDNAWEQMTQFFTEFMNETEREVTIEMFAITTFGIQTQIVQTMTMDLSRLHQTFELLKLGGPSPLYGGLNKALFAAGPVTSVLLAGMVVFPRIILISDGHATDPTLIQGPDVVEEEKMKMIMDSTCKVAMELAKRKVRVSCVPVGNANMTLLEKISSITNGKIYSFEDGALLAKFAKHNRQASKLIQHRNLLSEIKHQEVTLEEAMRDPSFVSSPLQKEKKVILDLAKYALEQRLYEDEREDPLFRMDMRPDEEEPDGLYYEERVNSENTLPKPGSRVCRGPDWNRGNEDVNGVGTVVGHPRDYWVNVVWDYSKTIYKYSYGAQGNFEVVIIDDPRVLDFDELIAVGCRVHRGDLISGGRWKQGENNILSMDDHLPLDLLEPKIERRSAKGKNWSYGNDDGGPDSKGVVLKVQEDGKVLVRWENKRKIYYDFGKEGNNAVEICSPFDVSLSFQQSPMWFQTQYLPPAVKLQNKNRVNKNE